MKTKKELTKQYKENQQTIQRLTEQNLMIKGYMEALEDLKEDNKDKKEK